MERVNDFLDQAREEAGEGEAPPPIAGEGIVAGIHAVIHSRLATGDDEGFREPAARVHVLRGTALLRGGAGAGRDAGRPNLALG